MSVIKGICWFIAVLSVSSAAVADQCLSNNTLERIEETVFSDRSYQDIPVHDDSGEVNLDFGYSFSRSGIFFIVKHFRPNFVFTYLVTSLDTGYIIEANFYSYGVLEGEPRYASYRIFYNKNTSGVEVLCGEDSTGVLTVDPIINVLPSLME